MCTKIKIINNYRINKEIKLLKDYYQLNNKGILINKHNLLKNKYPKVSIISSFYNSEKYIPRFVRSIQNQNLNDIELILIDDFSEDKSTKIIENKKKVGALHAIGEFLIFPDIDDIISIDILKKCYEFCKKYNYDLIRFNMYSDKNFIFSLIDCRLKSSVYQPELRTYLIYGYGYPRLVDGIISNKFIKKTSFLMALNNINEYYLNQKMVYFEDGLL